MTLSVSACSDIFVMVHNLKWPVCGRHSCYCFHLPLFSQELKLKFYNLMITLGHHDNDYLAICRHYMAIYQTPQVLADETKWKEVGRAGIKLIVLYQFYLA